MPNKHYRKGYEQERKVMNKARSQGLLSFRSAGSHSMVDVVIIDKYHRKIYFVQCKTGYLSENARNKLHNEAMFLNGGYKCEFLIR